jgi:hypothetical protein
VGKPEGKMRRTWEYIIKVAHKEWREGVEYVNLAGDKKIGDLL